MKNPARCFFIITLLLLSGKGHSQFLPLNAAGKCEVTEVMVADGFTKATLYQNGLKWLRGLTRLDGNLGSIKKDSLEGKISADYEFLVHSQSGILQKIAGAINFHFSLETKDGKYRYSFSNFVFHYYAQDRNYRMVKTGNTKPLEETNAAGWQKLWTQHRKSAFGKVTNQIGELKTKIILIPKDTNVNTEERKVDW